MTRLDARSTNSPSPPDEYACRIVLGVDEHRDEIDALIAQVLRALVARAHARRRPRAAAPRHVRAGWVPEVPTAVVITEAVELAKQYSTKDSGRFVNGLLVAHRRGRPLRAETSTARRRRPCAEIGTEEIVVPDTVEELLGEDDAAPDVPWVVLVWNDPST